MRCQLKTILLAFPFIIFLTVETLWAATWLDFAHPTIPHLDPALTNPNVPLTVDELMTDADVMKELPVLVVLLEFDDLPSQPQHNAAFYADMVFGQNRTNGMPSVVEVYQRLSNGRLKVVPAVTGDSHDDLADGIVGWVTAQSHPGCCKNGPDPIKLDIESCIMQGHTWLAGSSEYYGCWIHEKRAEGIRQADALFDYWQYNTTGAGGDTLITSDELVVMVVNAAPDSAFSGNSRRTEPSMIEVESGPDPLWVYQHVVGVAEGPEVSLLAHEMGHTALGMGDLYPACNTNNDRQDERYWCESGWYPPPPDWYTLMTWSVPGFVQNNLDPWHALHLGFLRARVVDRDGEYTLHDVETERTFTNQVTQTEALIIYDPLRPASYNDYFILENRNETVKNGNGVDRTDRGLAVWQIQDDGDTNRRIVRLVRRGGFWAGDLDALWDGTSVDTGYDLNAYSTPRDTDWADGSKSYIEIYDISPVGQTMTFKVRMPPIFIDLNYTLPLQTGYKDTPFDTLPEAIAAVPSPPRTIRIAGGNYVGPITISKPVTLMGWKNGHAIIGNPTP